MTIRAITLDLDDTLWPIWPTIDRAERVLHDWLSERAPRTAQRFPVAAMRALRDVLVSERPGIGHDFIAQRRLTLESALQSSGEDVALAEAALEIFTEQRNTVDLYPGVLAALERLAARFPIAALTNGTADLARIGIHQHFVFQIGAREHGVAKPHASIFLSACRHLGLAPGEVLHVGDDPELDVLGAHRAGLRSAWINREAQAWPPHPIDPDFIVRDLDELALRLEREPTP
ncbi:MAG: HAD family hydrolase [Chiayiivirga sp.]|nr:HAD family hydrolase [Xanthomonadaceae bacterium]MDX9765055.1 HAD family hydrolase [Chiayiivirga sp.]HRQ34657.1 HAD family hydrolase [Chiayiivirga sp.]